MKFEERKMICSNIKRVKCMIQKKYLIQFKNEFDKRRKINYIVFNRLSSYFYEKN